jgi:hypothetical protein
VGFAQIGIVIAQAVIVECCRPVREYRDHEQNTCHQQCANAKYARARDGNRARTDASRNGGFCQDGFRKRRPQITLALMQSPNRSGAGGNGLGERNARYTMFGRHWILSRGCRKTVREWWKKTLNMR